MFGPQNTSLHQLHAKGLRQGGMCAFFAFPTTGHARRNPFTNVLFAVDLEICVS